MYGEQLRGFKNFFIQTRINNYGSQPTVFLDTGAEAQKDMKVIQSLEVLDESCLFHVVGEKYPIRGNTPMHKVALITQYKKMAPFFLKFLKGENDTHVVFKKKSFLHQAFIVAALVSYQEFFINWMWFGMQDVYYPEAKYYTQPVRELYRVLDGKIRDIICAILEFDTAYRYRFQDLMMELNKENFKKNPLVEIKRLAGIAKERECQEFDDARVLGLLKLIKFLPLIIFCLRLNRPLLKKIQDVVEKMNINEIRLSVEDIYWTNRYKDYNFGGLDYQTRMKHYELTKNS